MPSGYSFRQVDEKHVSSQARLLCWSPKMDLIALANIQGEVVLHRLSWQKVWSLAPPSEGDMVAALSWRPDGKVIGVGYSSGEIVLCDIEDASVLHTSKLSATLASMVWIDRSTTNASSNKENFSAGPGFDAAMGDKLESVFKDKADDFLPKLPPFNKTYTPVAKGAQCEENFEDKKKLKNQQELNVLVAGTENGHVHLFAYGVFPVGVVDLNSTGMNGSVVSAFLSHDLQLLALVVESVLEDGETTEVVQISFDTTLLASHHQEIRTLALKFGQIASLLNYLESTIQQMTEAWEDILLEMDSKLAKFAEDKRKVCGGSVSNDFLRLLMFGVPSDELQNFLLHDLTEKGLKKLGHSIETSYSNIQKLVLKHLQSVGQALIYHLADVRGLALWYDKYGVLGLAPATVHQACSNAGSFMLKSSELQQVIDGGMKNFKAFFRRLYVVIQRLSDEPIPPELNKMTQQDINFVAQFLSENFTEEPEEGKSGFKLEKVGQYLKAEDLVNPPDNSGNPWVQFLEQSPKVQESNLLYKVHTKKSLVQMHNVLVSSIDDILQKCASVIGQSFQCVHVNQLYHKHCESEEVETRVTSFSKDVDGSHFVYTVFTTEAPPCGKCYVVRQPASHSDETSIEVTSFHVTTLSHSENPNDSRVSDDIRCDAHHILDLAFYDADTLSVLLQEVHEDSTPVLMQLPLAAIEQHFVTLDRQQCLATLVEQSMECVEINGGTEEVSWRRLDNMRACQVGVSGTRKVACVLFSSRRRVRLFMMDAEDEDDDDDVTHSMLHDVSSLHTSRRRSDVINTSAAQSEVTGNDTDGGGGEDGDENKENSPDTSNISGIDV